MATRRYSENVKMVSGPKENTYREKCEELGLQPLVERRDRQDMALVHKFLTEKSGTDMFRQIAATVSFAVRTVEKWNNLPNDVKCAQKCEGLQDRDGQTLSSVIFSD